MTKRKKAINKVTLGPSIRDKISRDLNIVRLVKLIVLLDVDGVLFVCQVFVFSSSHEGSPSKTDLGLICFHFNCIGKLFRTSDLPTIVEFFLMFHKDKPVDWLLDHILWVKVCSPDKDQVINTTMFTATIVFTTTMVTIPMLIYLFL